jgi:tetratricopeptide (TPR) repeat protein
MYADQGRLKDAENMFNRALAGYEKGLGPEHTFTLDTVKDLGLLYENKAVSKMPRICTTVRWPVLRKDWDPHTSTLDTVNNLGLLYEKQGRLEDAERVFNRALAGREKAHAQDGRGPLSPLRISRPSHRCRKDTQPQSVSSVSGATHFVYFFILSIFFFILVLETLLNPLVLFFSSRCATPQPPSQATRNSTHCDALFSNRRLQNSQSSNDSVDTRSVFRWGLLIDASLFSVC